MAMNQPDPIEPARQEWQADDEIDLRQIIDVLGKWRREIVLMTVLAAAIAGIGVLAYRVISANKFEASSTVVIAAIVNDVTFDERFRTLSNEDAASSSSGTASRRASLVGLVDSGDVAVSVIQALGDRLDPALRDPAELLEWIEAEVVSSQDNRTSSDLIRITASADTAQKAADIANAWANAFVERVNSIYGQVPVEVITAIAAQQADAQREYAAAQSALEAFVATDSIEQIDRTLVATRDVIEGVQNEKQTTLLLSFNKEQEALRTLLAQYIEANANNRSLALQADQENRTKILDALQRAQLDGVLAVIDQQSMSQVDELQRAYREQDRIQQLVVEARRLRAQLDEGGDAAAATNALALTLLKTQAFAASIETPVRPQPSEMTVIAQTNEQSNEPSDDPLVRQDQPPSQPQVYVQPAERSISSQSSDLPVSIQLNLETASSVSAADQAADVDALVVVLEERLGQLDTEIASLSAALLSGENYAMLDAIDPALLAISASGAEAVDQARSPLAQAIADRYQDLFQVGALAKVEQVLAEDTELSAEIKTLYDHLFRLGALGLLSEDGRQDLSAAAGAVPAAFIAATSPIDAIIAQLENQIQALKAERETQSAQRLQLEQRRDLAWSTLNTLQSKVVELNLERTASSSQVRLGASALPPGKPVLGPRLSISVVVAGAVGFILAIFVALLANYMGKEPFLSRRNAAAAPAASA